MQDCVYTKTANKLAGKKSQTLLKHKISNKHVVVVAIWRRYFRACDKRLEDAACSKQLLDELWRRRTEMRTGRIYVLVGAMLNTGPLDKTCEIFYFMKYFRCRLVARDSLQLQSSNNNSRVFTTDHSGSTCYKYTPNIQVLVISGTEASVPALSLL